MIGASEEEKLHIAAQIEDEARHTVFFDRFYREVVGLQGDDIMDVLDASFPWVSETFVGAVRAAGLPGGRAAAATRTTSGPGSATARTTSCGSRACSRCR